MEIERYILKKEASLRNLAKKIKDPKVFNFNYIPSKPLMREEIKPIVDSLLRYKKTSIPNNLIVVGSRGSGKTLTIKYLKNFFESTSNFKLLYTNCRQFNTSFKIVSRLLDLKPRGYSLSELYEKFKERYHKNTILVLDEVDMLSGKDKFKDIFYFLSRSDRDYMTILLSNNPHFLNSLDDPTRSSLQPEIIHFKNYDATEIKKILCARARAGLKNYNLNIISQIAALTVQQTNSDARIAIKTLYYCATQKGNVKDNFNRAQKDIVYEVVNNLNDHNILILKGIIGVKEKFVRIVHGKYRLLCRDKGYEGFSYPHFYSSLAYLQSLGLILLSLAKVNRAYTNTINLTFDPLIVDSIYNAKFEHA